MNIKVLQRLKKTLKAQPARFNMSFWGVSAREAKEDGDMDFLEVPPCKTQACMAGEICIQEGLAKVLKKGGLVLKNRSGSFFHDARVAADLTETQAQNLFYFKQWNDGLHGWPTKFEAAYDSAQNPKDRVKVAIARLDHFIKTGK